MLFEKRRSFLCRVKKYFPMLAADFFVSAPLGEIIFLNGSATLFPKASLGISLRRKVLDFFGTLFPKGRSQVVYN